MTEPPLFLQRGHELDEVAYAPSIGTMILNRVLCTAQLRSRNHLHGSGGLLRILNGSDPFFEVLDTWHGSLLISVWLQDEKAQPVKTPSNSRNACSNWALSPASI